MKKISYILMTLAVVASCTKTEISYDAPSHISIAPVAKVNTKASLTEYPTTGLPLHVFANTEDDESYLDDVIFSYDNTAQSFVNADAFWPNEKQLVFAGVSGSGNIGAQTNYAPVSMDFATNTLTIGTSTYVYNQPDSGNNDLLWFPTTAEYGKRADAVEVEMNHACALLQFNFIAESGLTGWKIKTLVVEDIYKSGYANCVVETATPKAVWTTSGSTDDFDVYTRAADANEDEYTIKNDDSDATTNDYITPENTTDNTIVIPQTPTSLTVTYEFTSQASGQIEETISIPLSIGKGIVDGNKQEKKWQSGKRYIYNITMGADQIKIAPTIGSWGNETVE